MSLGAYVIILLILYAFSFMKSVMSNHIADRIYQRMLPMSTTKKVTGVVYNTALAYLVCNYKNLLRLKPSQKISQQNGLILFTMLSGS